MPDVGLDCVLCTDLDKLISSWKSRDLPLLEIQYHLQTRVELLKREFGFRVGSRLREGRLARNVGQGGVAEVCGVTLEHISKIENGCSRGTNTLLERLAVELGLKLEWLLSGKGMMLDPDFGDAHLRKKGVRKPKPTKACVASKDAVAILRCFDRRTRCGRNDLAKFSGFSAAKVSSILNWLHEREMVQQHKWGVWELGMTKVDRETGKIQDG